MQTNNLVIAPVSGKAGRARFVDLGRAFSAQVANFVPQLRREQLELIDPAKNPFFDHAEVQLFIAEANGRDVGRIAAHIDQLALAMPAAQGFGPGTGMFGYFDAEDESVAHALLTTAQDWLRIRGMTRVVGPISLSIWEEPGLLVKGQDQAPTLMMGHHPAQYRGWIENAGFNRVKTLLTYELNIAQPLPPLTERIVKMGERNNRIVVREAGRVDYQADVRIILHILNDAWSGNWGFVPFTEREIAYAAKKLRPLVHPELVRIAELDGRPVAFMITFPDMNEVLSAINGRLFPLGWLRLLRWLRKPRGRNMRVPLMGVLKEHQNTRLASQLAFMMIEYIRREAVTKFCSDRGELGWVLDDNQGMVAIAGAIGSQVNREYWILEKQL